MSVSKRLKMSRSLKTFFPKIESNENFETIEIACTETGKLVIKNGDSVLFYCDTRVENIEQITCELFHRDLIILLLSTQKESCVVSIKQQKVLGQWQHSCDIYIDDWQHIGHEQVVVIFEDDRFLATDFRCCLFEKTLNFKQKNNCHNSYGVAAETGFQIFHGAFSDTINKTKTAIQKEKVSLQYKETLLQQCCNNLLLQSLNLSYLPRERKVLVKMLSKSNKICISQNSVHNANTEFLYLKGKWKRYCDKKVVIIFKVENRTGHVLKNVSGEVVCNTHLSCQSKMFFVQNQCGTNISEPKRKIQKTFSSNQILGQGDSFLLVCSTLNPVFNDFSLLQYYLCVNYSCSGQKYKTLISVEEIATCGILNEALRLPMQFESLDEVNKVAFNFMCDSYQFSLVSTITNMNSIPKLMAEKLNTNVIIYEEFYLIQVKHIDCQIRMKVMTKFKIEGIVSSRSESNIYIVFQEILKHLPVDICCQIRNCDKLKLFKQMMHEVKMKLNYYDNVLKEIIQQENVICIDEEDSNKWNYSHVLGSTNAELHALERDTDICLLTLLKGLQYSQ